MIKLLLIKVGDTFAALKEQQGDFEDMISNALGEKTLNITLYDPRKMATAPPLDDFQCVIITGSHAMVSDAEPWSEALIPYIKQMRRLNVPVLAICYGHQLVAKALGGTAGFHPQGPEPGTVDVTLTPQGAIDDLMSGLPSTFQVNVAHSQSVLQKPSDAVVLADNSFEPHQALRIGNIWSLQFHPEFNAITTQFYVREIAEQIRLHNGDVDNIYNACQDTPHSKALLSRFIHFSQTYHTTNI